MPPPHAFPGPVALTAAGRPGQPEGKKKRTQHLGPCALTQFSQPYGLALLLGRGYTPNKKMEVHTWSPQRSARPREVTTIRAGRKEAMVRPEASERGGLGPGPETHLWPIEEQQLQQFQTLAYYVSVREGQHVQQGGEQGTWPQMLTISRTLLCNIAQNCKHLQTEMYIHSPHKG